MVALEKRNTFILFFMTKGRIALFFVPFSLKNSEKEKTSLKEKELKIITHGKVCIENLSEAEQYSFYMEMLVKSLELHRQEQEQEREGVK